MIRTVTLQDIPAITAIYHEYVLHSTATFEIEPPTEKEMQARIESFAAHYPCLVYETDGEIAGYCYAHPWKEKAAYRHTLETTIYLHPKYIGRGIGKQLMKRLIEACRADGHHALIACITAENHSSCEFHTALGFEQVSLFKEVGIKFDRLLDVVDYELILKSGKH
ncbi:GNAT family N-acetyltransferase [uncultured Bacteroides sp.]|uniref:GNAT family N-acetyltransferase n=1 Tax=uncultured Bacteroides sp. TaxID=162156 RepID=UPI00261D61FF|nr:GNAT family N-acetyltransferase [uncultured Bacteroides sp.]